MILLAPFRQVHLQSINMRSSIIVTSWWSNSLALTCLNQLAAFAPERELYVVQAGKSGRQMDLFREFLPEGVTELLYPAHLLADDSPMREYLAKEALRYLEGAWFFDHDTFLLTPAEQWFEAADARFSNCDVCLCTRKPLPGAGGDAACVLAFSAPLARWSVVIQSRPIQTQTLFPAARFAPARWAAYITGQGYAGAGARRA